MTLTFSCIAVVGATGPTGRVLAVELEEHGYTVRAVSRRLDTLKKYFPSPRIEKKSGDALDFTSLANALAGCDLVVDCIGLPGRRMADHPATARNIARWIDESGARAVQVSSYWSFMPIERLPLAEDHPRADGPPWVRCRREAEEILRRAGAAVVHLPDFFGPHVHTGSLQMAITDAVRGKPMVWFGAADVARDYIYVPDAMRVVTQLLIQEAAYGEGWVVPGSGPVSANEIAGMLAQLLGRKISVRAAPPWLLRAVSLFNRELRDFMPLVPEYVKPISYDGKKLSRLLGTTPRTPYQKALATTIASLRSSSM